MYKYCGNGFGHISNTHCQSFFGNTNFDFFFNLIVIPSLML